MMMVLCVALIALIGVFALTKSFAAANSVYFSPASTTTTIGQTITLSLRVDPGSNTDAVQANITYDQNVLQFVSIDATNSAFPIEIQGTGGAGQLVIARGIFAPATISTDALIANVTFKVLVASPGSTIGVNAVATYQGNYLTINSYGATVIANSPAPPPPPGDTTVPAVSITSPVNGSKISTKTTVAAQASDNVGVTKMEVYIDNGIVQTSTGGTISYGWNLKARHTAKGAHTIVVKAYDAAGNVGSNSISVTY